MCQKLTYFFSGFLLTYHIQNCLNLSLLKNSKLIFPISEVLEEDFSTFTHTNMKVQSFLKKVVILQTVWFVKVYIKVAVKKQ